MRVLGAWFVTLLILGGAFAGDGGTERPDRGGGDRKLPSLTSRIDARLAARWAEARVRPAARADDGEFLRRASLDLVGRIPTAAEARDFLDDPNPGKRAALVDRLLDSPAYAARAAMLWRQLLLPEAEDQGQVASGGLEAWLEQEDRRGGGLRPDRPRDPLRQARRPRRERHDGGCRGRALAGRLLRGQGRQARDARRRLGPRLPRHPPRMRPVPQPPVRQVEAGGVLGLRRLLRRAFRAGRRNADRRGSPARTPTAAS